MLFLISCRNFKAAEVRYTIVGFYVGYKFTNSGSVYFFFLVFVNWDQMIIWLAPNWLSGIDLHGWISETIFLRV